MTESEIDVNLDFQRGMLLLDKFDTPERMIGLWKRMGNWPVRVPIPERVYPWDRGIEDLI